MQIELKIKEILEDTYSVDKKVEEILKFMNWDKKKLIDAIKKHGTYSGKQRCAIIKEFWGKAKL